MKTVLCGHRGRGKSYTQFLTGPQVKYGTKHWYACSFVRLRMLIECLPTALTTSFNTFRQIVLTFFKAAFNLKNASFSAAINSGNI